MTDRRRKVTIFGCGNWGSRIARRLAARGDIDLALVDERRDQVSALADELGAGWSSDPYGYLMVTGTGRDTLHGGDVIVATPPSLRVDLVRAILDGYGAPPARLRIEKPLAIDYHDGLRIISACADAGTNLTVGFTLLHHWLYESAFRYIQRTGLRPVRVVGVRLGKRPHHRAASIVDLGSHTASVAAYLGVTAHIATGYYDDAISRSTQIILEDGSSIYIDELNETIQLPDQKPDPDAMKVDALDQDLDAWLEDRHRGDRRVALGALLAISDELDRTAVAV